MVIQGLPLLTKKDYEQEKVESISFLKWTILTRNMKNMLILTRFEVVVQCPVYIIT